VLFRSGKMNETSSTTASNDNDSDIDLILLETLSRNQGPIRPNKLRKLVCKRSEITWTKFQSSLERLVSQEKVDIVVNALGEDTVCLNKKVIQRMEISDASFSKQEQISSTDKSSLSIGGTAVKDDEEPPQQYQLFKTIKVPSALVLYLTRNSRAKLNSIEQNTKTIITILEKEQDQSQVTLTIEPSSTEDDTNVAKQEKRLKFAFHLLETMVASFQEHPKHFLRKEKVEGVDQMKSATVSNHPREKTQRKKRKFY